MSQNFKVKNGLDINGVQVIAANGQLTGPAATQITNIVSNSSDTWVRTQANAAYSQSNTGTVLAQAAFDTANNSTDTWVRTAANSASSYANSAFATANSALSSIPSLSGYATESYVSTQIANLVDSAPTTLDTLNELAAALGDDANFSTTISNMVGVSGGYANSAFATANIAVSGGAAIYAHAEGAFTTANLAYNSTASINNYINGVNGVQNTNIAITGSYANSAFTAANAALSGGSTTYGYASLAFGKANSAFDTANAALGGSVATYAHAAGAYSHANAAFIKANTIPTGLSNVAYNSFGVGTAASGTTGEIRATNDITAFYSSDNRLKENIQDVTNALDIVCSIGSKTYDWKDEHINSRGGEDGYFVRKSDFGVIAQDVEAVFPQAVRTREDGTKVVDYEKLGTLAFGAIKELVIRIETLEKK